MKHNLISILAVTVALGVSLRILRRSIGGLSRMCSRSKGACSTARQSPGHYNTAIHIFYYDGRRWDGALVRNAVRTLDGRLLLDPAR